MWSSVQYSNTVENGNGLTIATMHALNWKSAKCAKHIIITILELETVFVLYKVSVSFVTACTSTTVKRSHTASNKHCARVANPQVRPC